MNIGRAADSFQAVERAGIAEALPLLVTTPLSSSALDPDQSASTLCTDGVHHSTSKDGGNRVEHSPASPPPHAPSPRRTTPSSEVREGRRNVVHTASSTGARPERGLHNDAIPLSRLAPASSATNEFDVNGEANPHIKHDTDATQPGSSGSDLTMRPLSSRRRLLGRVCATSVSPLMSFSSALNWETIGQWSASDDDEMEGDADSVDEQQRAPDRGRVKERLQRATPIIGDERTSLLRGFAASSPDGDAAALSPSSSLPRQVRRPWHRRLYRYLRRHAGWYLFMAVFFSLQLVAALVIAGDVIILRASYSDVLLHLRPWGVASCVCGVGMVVAPIALVLCLRQKAVLYAMGGVVLLILLLVLLLGITLTSIWLVWILWDADSSQSLSYVYAVWEAAVKDTRRRAAAGEATDRSTICLFQAAHHCSGFLYGCCNDSECFNISVPSASSSNSLIGADGGDGDRTSFRPAWAELVCPVCRGDGGGDSTDSNTGSGGGSSVDGYTGAPAMCTMSLLPSMLGTVAPYACLNVAALCVSVGAVACTRFLHFRMRNLRDMSSGTRPTPPG
ncbi:hypothetical protein ABL78_6393 [Leptomonas seymouri]|uniref:Uncharacterized protein n=1 Tax=Leptomonas seymouri TaxID=5684 RepID=A0A0N1HTU1_LEPSE|nr:hypothetical protein ABL78_6393 [Leptomonas seymouri]|eukprot:KPI84552.1 hypothetical protein ABL78_6393 [Leptomonas seymouri]